jgi:hypothetical protein
MFFNNLELRVPISLRENWLASSCLLSDAKPFSSRGRNAGAESGGRNAVAAEHLYHSAQPPPQTFRPCLLPDDIKLPRASNCCSTKKSLQEYKGINHLTV